MAICGKHVNGLSARRNHSGVRHAQWQAAVPDANTGIAVTIDAGDNADLHPTDKTLVGRRADTVLGQAQLSRAQL